MEEGPSFNDEIDEYIEERRSVERRKKRGFFLKLFKRWTKKKIEREKKDPIEVQEEELEEIEHDIEEIDREEEELEEVREGLMTRFLKILRKPQQKEEETEEIQVVEDDEEDQAETVEKELVLEVIKLQHKWLNTLPADKASRFKRDPDYERYKELLSELGFIK